jgi:hypothetical protein
MKKKSFLIISSLFSVAMILAAGILCNEYYFKSTDNPKYHYPVTNCERKSYLNGVKLTETQSKELYKYENEVRDYIYSLWELPTRPQRNWKREINIEICYNGYLYLPDSSLHSLEEPYTEMGQSVAQLVHYLISDFLHEMKLKHFPPPSFIRDTIPSWERGEYIYPITIELDSEVLYSMDDLPKTQKRDKALWKNY